MKHEDTVCNVPGEFINRKPIRISNKCYKIASRLKKIKNILVDCYRQNHVVNKNKIIP